MERILLRIIVPGFPIGYGVACIVLQKAWLLGPGSAKTHSFADDITVVGGNALLAGIYFIGLGLMLHLVAYRCWPAAARETDPNGPASKRAALGMVAIVVFVMAYGGLYVLVV